MKTKFINFFLDVAKAAARLSEAKRMQVGAVVFNDDCRILGSGFNGTPTGYFENNCENTVDGELVTKDEVVHAEMNILAFMAKEGIASKDCSMMLTHSPCYNCSKL